MKPVSAAVRAAMGCLVLAGCKRTVPTVSTADAQPPSVASAHASATPPALSSRLPCRAIALTGMAAVDGAGDAGTPLAAQAELPDSWLALGDGARLVAKDPRTARETTFIGPARVRACVDGAEESWVAAGAFESSAGAGEAPGAEEWVVTPHAVVRYSAARVRVDVRPSGTTATIGTGVAFVWPPQRAAPDHDAEGWQRVEGGPAVQIPGASDADPASSLARCSDLAQRTRALTEALLSGAADATVVKDQVTSRRLARAACDVAHLRLSENSSAHQPPDWAARLAEAEKLWRALR